MVKDNILYNLAEMATIKAEEYLKERALRPTELQKGYCKDVLGVSWGTYSSIKKFTQYPNDSKEPTLLSIFKVYENIGYTVEFTVLKKTDYEPAAEVL